jgi:tetratricopeptide (TPR) repeat protein
MDMGRIDTDVMYENVKKWTWKNSNGDIYVDPETRKNSISFRNSLGRLADEFIKKGNFDKAEEILDLSMEKMPIDKYGYYRLVIGYIDSYYNIKKPEKARFIAEFLTAKFREKINYYSGVSSYELTQNFKDLEGNLDLYRYIIATVQEFDTAEYTEKMKEEFIASVSLLEDVIEEK